MAATRKGTSNFLDSKSHFPQHRVERLMGQDVYCGLTSGILEEGAFIELTPEGLPLQQVFLGLTAVEFIVVTQEIPNTYNVRNKNDLELEGLHIDAIYPLPRVRFSLSTDRPMAFSVITPGDKQLHFEMCKLDCGYIANWNVWHNILDYVIENQPHDNKSFNRSPIQTSSLIYSASLSSRDSFSVVSDLDVASVNSFAQKSDSTGFMISPHKRLVFFFGGHNTMYSATKRSTECGETPRVLKSSSWNDVISAHNKTDNVFDVASFRKILKKRDMMAHQSTNSPIYFESSNDTSDEEDIEKLFREARTNVAEQKCVKRTGSQLWSIVQRKLLDRGLGHVVFQAVSARKRSIATSIRECRPLEVAKELTIMSRRLLMAVRPADLEHYRRSPSKHNLPTSLQRIATFGDSVCKLVMAEILSNHVISDRAMALKFFTDVCFHLLFTWRDFQTLICVLRGMTSLPVYRLRDTWATFFVQEPLKFCQFQAIATLLSPRGHYRSYRTRVKACNFRNSPYIPWFDHLLDHCNRAREPHENAIVNTNKPVIHKRPVARVSLRHQRAGRGASPVNLENIAEVTKRKVFAKELHQGKISRAYNVTVQDVQGVNLKPINDIETEQPVNGVSHVHDDHIAARTKRIPGTKLDNGIKQLPCENELIAVTKRKPIKVGEVNPADGQKMSESLESKSDAMTVSIDKKKNANTTQSLDKQSTIVEQKNVTVKEQITDIIENKNGVKVNSEEEKNVVNRLINGERLEDVVRRKLDLKAQQQNKEIIAEINRVNNKHTAPKAKEMSLGNIDTKDRKRPDANIDTKDRKRPDANIDTKDRKRTDAKMITQDIKTVVGKEQVHETKTDADTIEVDVKFHQDKDTVIVTKPANKHQSPSLEHKIDVKVNVPNKSAVATTHQNYVDGPASVEKRKPDVKVQNQRKEVINEIHLDQQTSTNTKKKCDIESQHKDKKKLKEVKPEHDKTTLADTKKKPDTKVSSKKPDGKMLFQDELSAAVSKRNSITEEQGPSTNTKSEVGGEMKPRVVLHSSSSPTLKSILKTPGVKKEHKKKGLFKLFKSKKQKRVKFLLSKTERARAIEMEKRNSNMKHLAKAKRYLNNETNSGSPVSGNHDDNAEKTADTVPVSPALEKFCDQKSDDIMHDALKVVSQKSNQKSNTQLALAKDNVQAPKSLKREPMKAKEKPERKGLTSVDDRGDINIVKVQELSKTKKKGAVNWMLERSKKRRQTKQTTGDIDHVNQLQREIDSIDNLIEGINYHHVVESDEEADITDEIGNDKKGVKDVGEQSVVTKKQTAPYEVNRVSKKEVADSRKDPNSPEVRRKSYVPASVYQNRRKSLFEQAYDETKDQDLNDHFTHAMNKQLRSIQGKRKSIALDLLEVSDKDLSANAKTNNSHCNVCNNANGDNGSPTETQAFKFTYLANPLCYGMDTANVEPKHSPITEIDQSTNQNAKHVPIGLHRSTSAECIGIVDINEYSKDHCFYCGGDVCIYSKSSVVQLLELQTRALSSHQTSCKRVRECLNIQIESTKHLTNYDLLSVSLSTE